MIDNLKLNIPVSPIDWMRAEIIRAGYSVAEITGRIYRNLYDHSFFAATGAVRERVAAAGDSQ